MRSATCLAKRCQFERGAYQIDAEEEDQPQGRRHRTGLARLRLVANQSWPRRLALLAAHPDLLSRPEGGAHRLSPLAMRSWPPPTRRRPQGCVP